MAKVTIEREYLGHNFKLTFESDVQDDLSEFNVDGRINMVLNRELQRAAEITVSSLNTKRQAEELETARRAAPQGMKVVDATVGRQRRLMAVPADSIGPSVVLGAGGKENERRFVVGEGGRLLRTKPGAEVVAVEEDGGKQ